MWINGGYFVFRREIFDYIGRGRGTRRGAVPATDRRRQAHGLSVRGLLGADGHAEGEAAPRRVCSKTGVLRGCAGSAMEAESEQKPSGRRTDARAALERGGPPRARCACWRSARMRTTSRSAVGGRFSGWRRRIPRPRCCWIVLSADGRARRGSAPKRSGVLVRRSPLRVLLGRVSRRLPSVRRRCRQGVLRGSEGARSSPDVIFTHQRADLHQDHRLAAELTWNTFRDHLVLEYEIPKYDGDLGRPNVFVHLNESIVKRKIESAARTLRHPVRAGTGSPRISSVVCCACAGWSRIRRAGTPRPSTAGSSCFSRCPAGTIDGVQVVPLPADPGRARHDLPHAAIRRPATSSSSGRSTSRASTRASSRVGTSTAR